MIIPLTSETGTPDREVDAEAFAQAVRPAVDTLIRVLSAYNNAYRSAGGLPTVASRAMAEIAAEKPLRSDAWSQPAQTTQSSGGLLIAAGNDHTATFARLFRDGPTPMFSQHVIVRSGLECYGRAAWLSGTAFSAGRRWSCARRWR